MIGGDDGEVAGHQPAFEFRQPPVECLKRGRVARDVAAVAEKTVEIDQIGKQEVSVAEPVERGKRRVEYQVVSGGLDFVGDAAMGENIADLADSDHPAAAPRQPVEQGRLGRRHGIIPPVAGANEIHRGFSEEGPCNHPPDLQLVDQTAGDFADRIEAVQSELGLMRCDLEDRIGRCVADRLVRQDMLRAEFGDDLRPGGMLVAEDARQFRFTDERLGEVFGKAGDGPGEITPLECHRDFGDLPMAGGRILAAGDLDPVSETRLWRSVMTKVGKRLAGRRLGRLAKAEPVEIGQVKRTFAQPRPVAAPGRTVRRDMAERIGAFVAKRGGVVGSADSDGIKHDKDRAFHCLCLRNSNEWPAGQLR